MTKASLNTPGKEGKGGGSGGRRMGRMNNTTIKGMLKKTEDTAEKKTTTQPRELRKGKGWKGKEGEREGIGDLREEGRNRGRRRKGMQWNE